ncbi:MAG: mechanosensitive ion channel family protein [Nitrospirota bacterium]
MAQIVLFVVTYAAAIALTAWPAHAAQPDAGPSEATSREALEAAESTAVVELDGAVLFPVRGTTSYPAEQRASAIRKRIEAAARDSAVRPDAIRTVEADATIDIMAGDRLLMSVFEADARMEGLERRVVAAAHAGRIRSAIEQYRRDRSPDVLFRGAVGAGIATIVFGLSVWLAIRGLRRAERTLEARYKARIHGLTIKSFEVVQSERVWGTLTSGLKTLRVLVVLVLLFTYVEFSFALFPWTRPVAAKLGTWVLDPIVTLGQGALSYVPNVVFLAILFVVFRYVLKVTRLFFNGLERGSVTISGFDAEWAQPTYRIVRLLMVVFAVVVAYPYIPGAESPAFKGLSIFLGLMVSLGSSSVIGNILAGYSLTYRRAFRVGDRVKIEDVVGDVEAIRLQVTHLRTVKNEEIIMPNSKILSTEIVNYSSLARTRGLILHTTVGIGYETPWRQVEEMLRIAAARTPGLLKDPAPFVLQKSLGDFAVVYELNAYCDNAQAGALLYSAMHRNILDVFNEYGVQIMTPAYEGDPEKPKVVPKEQWHAAPAPTQEGARAPSPPEG